MQIYDRLTIMQNALTETADFLNLYAERQKTKKTRFFASCLFSILWIKTYYIFFGFKSSHRERINSYFISLSSILGIKFNFQQDLLKQ